MNEAQRMLTGCHGNSHEIPLNDSDEPSGSDCVCGKVSIWGCTQTKDDRLIGINIVIEEGA